MNAKQFEAYNYILEGKNVFLTGKSGSGKSYVIKKCVVELKKRLKKIAVTSTTGTSALLIGGTTIHSYLGIGIGNQSVERMKLAISANPIKKKRWRELDVLIIDEISMLPAELFDKLEELARQMRNSKRVFGGIKLVLCGDFFQLPVVKSDKLCFEALSWSKCVDNTVYLTELMRQSDVKFQQCLEDVRIGKLSLETKKMLKNRMNVKLENSYDIIPTRLYSTNKSVEVINDFELDKLSKNGNEFYEYVMDYKVLSSEKFKESLIDKFKKNCIATENLQLCIGAQVMLLINLNIESGLVNGSRGVVLSFMSDNLPIVKFLNGMEVAIQYNTWIMEENDEIVLEAIQIPLKVAYAMSIHKSQGMTLDYLEVDLADVFSYGMAYVALSRVKNYEGLKILGIDFTKIKSDPKVIKFYEDIETKTENSDQHITKDLVCDEDNIDIDKYKYKG